LIALIFSLITVPSLDQQAHKKKFFHYFNLKYSFLYSFSLMSSLYHNFFHFDGQRKATELEREQRLGRVGNEKYPKMIAEHPVFLVNNKSNDLLMSKRAKLKTVREKNAEELTKQGKRWERERLMRVEQERQKEISTRKDREKQLEDHTLYIFDPDKIDLSGMDLSKIKGRKMTECEIDLKDFLLTERNKKRLEQHTLGSSEDR
jgi:hypothetical protein